MAHRLTTLRHALPGLALCAAATIAALALGRVVPGASPLLVAIVLGAVLANLGWIPARGRPGLAVASTTVLRVGIALLGLVDVDAQRSAVFADDPDHLLNGPPALDEAFSGDDAAHLADVAAADVVEIGSAVRELDEDAPRCGALGPEEPGELAD